MDQSKDNDIIFSLETKHSFSWNLSTSSLELDQPLCFWIFFVFDVFAILCSIFTLFHLLVKSDLRKALQNHALIIILIFGLLYDLIDIPLHLQFFSTGVVRPAIAELCLIWWFIDLGFFYTIEMLLLFSSIERHILIFHSQILATHRKRLFFHYLPMLCVVLLMMIFYSVAIFAPICENKFDFTSNLCGMYACYASQPFFIILEQIGFSTVSSCFIAVFNIALLIRIFRQKHRIRRPIQWRKQHKLAIQMILMSIPFLIFSLPLTIIYLVRFFYKPDWAIEIFPRFFVLSYFAIFCLPFVCLATLPNLWDKLKKLIPRRRWKIAVVLIQ